MNKKQQKQQKEILNVIENSIEQWITEFYKIRSIINDLLDKLPKNQQDCDCDDEERLNNDYFETENEGVDRCIKCGGWIYSDL